MSHQRTVPMNLSYVFVIYLPSVTPQCPNFITVITHDACLILPENLCPVRLTKPMIHWPSGRVAHDYSFIPLRRGVCLNYSCILSCNSYNILKVMPCLIRLFVIRYLETLS